MKNQLSFLLVAVCCAVLLSAVPGRTQRLIGRVTINTEKLTPEVQTKLAGLQDQIVKYINEYDWTDDSRRYNIDVLVDIYVERMEPLSYEERWEVRVVISNQGDFQASDRRWSFPYRQGDQFVHSDRFHPLTSLLDFYFNILLAQEYDKVSKLGGTPYYQKAFDVAQQSKFTEYFNQGWKERSEHIEQVRAESRNPLRELEYFFAQARNRLRVDDRKTSEQYLRVVVLRLKGMNAEDEGVQRFYQLHHLDLARMLSNLGMSPQLQELTALDPPHTATYDEFIKKIGQ
ncbi:MAG: DUF4835 family protein [Candidatus Zixiibacteriota bacterium]|nr:MAG: DUF4835 family protein [candidate division Zixibacteria bacterium]